MKATIEAISPQGYKVQIEVDASEGMRGLLKQLADVQIALGEAGYEPGGELPKTPDGLPICPKHRVVMKAREKQGDHWWSHIVRVGSQELYCKGRPGDDSPGWAYLDSRKQFDYTFQESLSPSPLPAPGPGLARPG